MWSLGVLGYEAVTHKAPALRTASHIFACANGPAKYPWEGSLDAQPEAWRRSRLRVLLAPCLARDAVRRPSAETLLEHLHRVGCATTGPRPPP
jgi:serine/threonine protein kinase